jgi:hypothetical protein
MLDVKRGSRFTEFAMIGVFTSAIIPFALIATLVIFNCDPLWYILPETEIFAIHSILWVLRLSACSLAAYGGWINLATVFMVAILELKIFKETAKCQGKWALNQCYMVSTKNAAKLHFLKMLNTKFRKLPQISILKVLKIQRQSRILFQVTNEAYHFFYPFLLLNGLIILVLSNYATIKMQDRIPMPFYLVMPFLSLFVVLLIMALFPAASDIYEDSEQFLRLMRYVVGRDKYWRKVWRAERAVKIQFGRCFFAKRSTKTTFLCQCIDFTVNTLLIT